MDRNPDVVEAGRDRPPPRRGPLAVGAVVLAVLAGVGTWRAVDADPVARRRPSPSPSPSVSVPPLETVDPDYAPPLPGDPPMQAQGPFEDAPIELLLGSDSAIRRATTAGPDAETWIEPEPGWAIRSTVRLGDGVAAVLLPDEFGDDTRSWLVVRSGGVERRHALRGPQRLVPGENDDELWTVDWLGTRAQRRDATGKPVGRPVPLPERTELVRVLRGGLLLVHLQTYEPGIAVWDPARRRYARVLARKGLVVASTRAAVAWMPACGTDPCPLRVTQVATWRTAEVPTPGPGHLRGAALDPLGERLAFGWADVDDTKGVYVAPLDGTAVEVVADGVSGEVLLDWAGDRLVLAQALAGTTLAFVWTPDTGLRGGLAYDSFADTATFHARPLS